MEIPNLDPLGFKTTFSMTDASSPNNGTGSWSGIEDFHFKKEHLFYSAYIYRAFIMCYVLWKLEMPTQPKTMKFWFFPCNWWNIKYQL